MAAADLLEQRVNTLAYNCVCTSVHPRAGGICRGCRATEMGRNCWEMAVSPCCDLSRDSCDTCPVFAAAMRELSLAENARIVLEGGAIVEGEVYLRRDQRLSDAINDPTKDYIAVADATIYPPATVGGSPEKRDVVLVSKRAAYMVYPLEGEQASEETGATRGL